VHDGLTATDQNDCLIDAQPRLVHGVDNDCHGCMVSWSSRIGAEMIVSISRLQGCTIEFLKNLGF